MKKVNIIRVITLQFERFSEMVNLKQTKFTSEAVFLAVAQNFNFS